MQAQNNRLTRLEDREGLPIDWLRDEGNYAIAFLMNIRDSHLSKARPCRCLFLIGESRIPHCSFGAQILLEHCLERTLPTLAECRNPQRALQLLAGMSWQIQEGINVGHTDSLWTISNFYNIVARTNFSLLQHAKVESWPVMLREQGWHARFVHANADAVACYAGLRHFKCRITDAVAIANADLVIRKSLNGEVFAELAKNEVFTSEKAPPLMIRIRLINKNGALLTTMTGEIGLGVANKIELAHHLSSLNGTFPDCGTDSLTVPCHVAWETGIDLLRSIIFVTCRRASNRH